MKSNESIDITEFMKRVMKDAEEHNIDCFIATEAGSRLYGDHKKFHAKDFHLMLFGSEMPANYGKKDNDDMVLPVIKRSSNKLPQVKDQPVMNQYTFGDIVSWMINDKLLFIDCNEYYFCLALDDLFISVRFHNIDYNEMWIYRSPKLIVSNILPIAVIKLLTDDEGKYTGEVSIRAINDLNIIQESEIIMKSKEQLSGIRLWNKTKFGTIFSIVEITLTALLSMDYKSLTPLAYME